MKTIEKNTILADAKDILIQLIDGISDLTHDDFVMKHDILSGSSIGAHTRHIIEIFQQLINDYASGTINYDKRNRNKNIETDIDTAIECIAGVINGLVLPNKALKICNSYNGDETTDSNYYRELIYNIEHCIHHQAIIKIAFLQNGMTMANKDFGVAKSTIEYRKQCAQ